MKGWGCVTPPASSSPSGPIGEMDTASAWRWPMPRRGGGWPAAPHPAVAAGVHPAVGRSRHDRGGAGGRLPPACRARVRITGQSMNAASRVGEAAGHGQRAGVAVGLSRPQPVWQPLRCCFDPVIVTVPLTQDIFLLLPPSRGPRRQDLVPTCGPVRAAPFARTKPLVMAGGAGWGSNPRPRDYECPMQLPRSDF